MPTSLVNRALTIMKLSRLTIAAVVSMALYLPAASAQETPAAAAAKCEALVAKDKFAEAKPYCEKASKEFGHEGAFLYGRFFELQGMPYEAINTYEDILARYNPETKPSDAQLKTLRACAVLKNKMNQWHAINYAVAYLAHAPDDAEVLEVAARFSQEPKKSEYKERLLALKPTTAEGNVGRARTLLKSGDGQGALAAAQAALKLEPKSTEALAMRGYAYSAMEDHANAERDHAAVARMRPKAAGPRVDRAEALLKLNRFEDAIDVANEALKLEPEHAQGLYVRARASLMMGDAEGALLDIEMGNEIAPNELWEQAQQYAENMLYLQKNFPEAVVQLERDIAFINGAVATHLQSTCGYYRVFGNDADTINAELRTYRNCIVQWSNDGKAIVASFGPDVREAAGRIDEFKGMKEHVDPLLCSKMPKKARCVSDSLNARADAALAVHPKQQVGGAEFARLNQEVGAYNASVSRTNAMIKTASFLEAVASALAAQ